MAHDPTAAHALVLSSPALRTNLSLMQGLMMATVGRLMPDFTVGNGLDADFISHDPAVVSAYKTDPLVHDRVSSTLAQAIVTGGAAARAAAPEWKIPTLLMYSGDDRLVAAGGSAEFAAAAPKLVVTSHRFDALYHEIFNERDRAEPVRILVEWLRLLANRLLKK